MRIVVILTKHAMILFLETTCQPFDDFMPGILFSVVLAKRLAIAHDFVTLLKDKEHTSLSRLAKVPPLPGHRTLN